MTLLESVVAFVVLTLVGIACLDLSRGAIQLERHSAEWTQAVARAESAMTSAAAGVADDDTGPVETKSGTPTVSRRPWRATTDLLEVTIPLADGGVYRLQRLVPRTAEGVR